ncbi:conserved hypothetical protein [Leishmania braziliensis MHOM/BR/75/M2904]|uniref:RING-type domain-containing protein n=2 Tax=Leishmania braziliensis TaxID=5660 RepID=A4HEX2_LEIBR|nr:conserved hypothetical protein [Leishmania braziliensis MHOM/BR/75/M2904]CAJ2474688.1 unnamed protein product [Leishmania braziliensis]CAM39381.2 conserved hypothetical protein [Leishmania braziliensis MHOM/BR/75/M2904]SYZ66778.1 Ring_finger_domain_containing_protein [Leishmania braziliensis MHOM/BR/75/M2904]
MLLHEALLCTECPICLQPLGCRIRPPHSRPASPPILVTPARVTTDNSEATSSTSPSGSSPHSPLQLDGLTTLGEANEFRITFAPGVYGIDAADPWHPSLATPSPASPHELSSSLDQRSFALSGASLSGSGHAADSSSVEGTTGVVVLPCGHLLHYLCAMQLCEYATHPSCPVCRLKLASDADLILFRPQLRASSIVAAQAPVGISFSCTSAITTRKRRRPEEAERVEHCTQCADNHGTDDNANSGQVFSLESASQRVCAPSPAVVHTLTSKSGGECSATTRILKDVLALTDACATPKTLISPGTSRQEIGSDVDASQDEDDITIVGARQLPPSQAYAELLLRTTATWTERAETLKTRVEHLERSQQQLQSDCSELERTLTVARRRRELLLTSSSPKDEQDTLRSAQRLRELRRLSLETRTAMLTSTAQLAEAIRDHAEVQRQTEKYMRKLSRLDCEKGDGGTGASSSGV